MAAEMPSFLMDKYLSSEEAINRFLTRPKQSVEKIRVIENNETKKEPVNLDPPKEKVQKEFKVPKVEVSKNIQRFDKKPKVYTENPFSYNAVSLKKKVPETYNPGSQELLTNPTYNTVGKYLGVDVIHDWNRYSDKVFTITEWAKKETGGNDLDKLINWIGKKSKSVPNLGNKVIDNLYIFAKLSLKNE